MGYIYMAIISVLFSFGGIFVKFSSLMVNSYWISFLRFFIGTLFLLIYMVVTKKKIQLRFLCTPIVLGAIFKSINYLTENYGLANGYSYGNIIVWPMQCIVALIVSVLLFKEKAGFKGFFGTALCIFGIGMISLNGRSFDAFISDGLFFLILFGISGIAAAGFVIMQKLLLKKMSAENMNLSMFTLASVITACPLPFVGEITGEVHLSSIICIVLFGVTTGLGFLLIAKAMQTIPLFMVTIIQSSTVIFTLVWAVLFLNEKITNYILLGTLIFIVGMIITNIKLPKKEKKYEAG